MKILCLLFTLAALFCAGCSSSIADSIGKDVEDTLSNTQHAKNRYVQMVKNGHPNEYPNRTYEQAFSNFFAQPQWKYFKSDDQQNVVEFTGDCTYQDVPVKARIQFVVDEKAGTFETTYLAFNEVPQNRLVLSALLEKAFTEPLKK